MTKRLFGFLILFLVSIIQYFGAKRWLVLESSSQYNIQVECITYDPRYRFSYLSSTEVETISDKVQATWIDEDLAKIKRLSSCIRTYTVRGGMREVPRIAKKYGLKVIMGVHVSNSTKINQTEVDTAIRLANSYTNIISIIAGNEVYLHNYLGDHTYVDPRIVKQTLKTLREKTKAPLSYADAFNTWRDTPDLVPYVDFISINELPYWSKQTPESAIGHLESLFDRLSKRYPSVPVFLSEVGWPTGGPPNEDSVPGMLQLDLFMNEFLPWAKENKIHYNFFEAFDQPWKISHHEGLLGTQWGLLSAGGDAKLTKTPRTTVWTYASLTLGLLIGAWYLLRSRCAISLRGSIYYFVLSQLALFLASRMFLTSQKLYLTKHFASWTFILIPGVLLFLLVLFELYESVLAINQNKDLDKAPEIPHQTNPSTSRPFVSIHVASCSEPPQQVIQTIQSLLSLDYDSFEIIVMDNNTRDPNLYRPVADFCAGFPDKVIFLHKDHLDGFKSGALNYALKHTNPNATIIGIVDSDYVVNPDWLKDLTPYFSNLEIAAVQAPQSYRDWEDSQLSTMMRDEYEGFFKIGMPLRSQNNSLILHGTMLLLCRKSLEKVGGWAEWCLTEDTELGLRFLLDKKKTIYTPNVYGTGLVPSSSLAFLKQRFRWVHGAMSILIRYRRDFLGIRSRLSITQRISFLTGWLPWIVDIFSPLFTLVGILSTYFYLKSHLYFPPAELAFPFLFYFVFRFMNSLVTYRVRVPITWKRVILSSIAGIGLTWVIAGGAILGLFLSKTPFYRTQKTKGTTDNVARSQFWSFFETRLPLYIGLLLIALSLSLLMKYGLRNIDTSVWSLSLIILSLPLFGVSYFVLRYETRD